MNYIILHLISKPKWRDMPIHTQPNQDLILFDNLIDQLIENQYGVNSHFLHKELVTGLRQKLLYHYNHGEMKMSGTGRQSDYIQNSQMRSDFIHWIDNDSKDLYESELMEKIRMFILQLNRTCFTNINDFEFHYAYYDIGCFYKKHVDQFKSNTGRKFSMVMYLNDDWKSEDGGEIELYLPDKTIVEYPDSGKVLFFRSDETPHEVKPSISRPRLSIAGWLKSV